MTLKIVTANLNGVRSASKKGFLEWLAHEQPDIVCLQEIKAHAEHMTEEMLCPQGYVSGFSYAEKRGYSGVGIYSKRAPEGIIHTFDNPIMDGEGRFIQFDFEHYSVISLYLPSGTSGPERQAIKMDILAVVGERLAQFQEEGRGYIICGDINIAHTKKDIKNWRGNQKNSGFLPEERAWLDYIFDELGFVDAFRVINQEDEQYTWWSNRGQAYANNVGWRIDYQIISPQFKDAVKSATIYKAEKFSDHAPLIMEYDIP